MRRILKPLLIIVACAACGEDETALRMKMGHMACDIESRALLGRVVDVVVVRDTDTPYLAYVIEGKKRQIIKPSELAFASDCHPSDPAVHDE